MTTAIRYLVVPGIDGSDGHHWQSRWEVSWDRSARRISPTSWSTPDLDDWVAAVDRTARLLRSDGGSHVVVVAHSLGCWAAAEWIVRARPASTSAFMVAVPDVDDPHFPHSAAPSFVGVKATQLGVPAMVVSSDDDPYCSTDRAAELAASWGADWRNVGPSGHLNSASRLGTWIAGQALLTAFLSLAES